MQTSILCKLPFYDNNADHYYFNWQTENPKLWMHIMHGMAEHSERYKSLAKFLNQHDISVTADDHRGHGVTGSKANSLYHFADKDGWNKLINDQWQLISHLRKRETAPLVILGHSMGSYLALGFCQKYAPQLDNMMGLVLSASGHTSPNLSRLGRGLAFFERFRLGKDTPSPILEHLSTGHFNRQFDPVRTPKDWISSDSAVVDNYIKDPWCGGAISTQSWFDFLGGLIDIFGRDWKKTMPRPLPVYLFSGALDPVGNRGLAVKALRKRLLQLNTKKVDMRLYPEGRHEMLNEINRERVFMDLLDWLNQVSTADKRD
jgi:alpha-beta hydrolase superfamily lysophospholipase